MGVDSSLQELCQTLPQSSVIRDCLASGVSIDKASGKGNLLEFDLLGLTFFCLLGIGKKRGECHQPSSCIQLEKTSSNPDLQGIFSSHTLPAHHPYSKL